MNCGEFQALLPAYFDAPFKPEIEKEFQEHLRVCNQCTIKYNRMKHYFEKLKEIPAIIPLPKMDQDELIRKLQKEIGSTNDIRQTAASNGKTPASVPTNVTAELGRVETVHNKKKRAEINPLNKNILFFFLAVLLVLIGFYAFLMFFKKH